MLTETHGKGGHLCGPAKEGQLRCPLIVRPTSEDVITGYVFQTLRAINPRWWLPQLLNQAVGAARFQQQYFRRLSIDLWKNYPPYPRELLPWDEGSTQVDVTITWENPPTTVFIEAKFGSDLSGKTARDDGRSGFPSDQLVRNIRVGLFESGYFQCWKLFKAKPRDFVVIVMSPFASHELVKRYCDPHCLRAAIPHSDRLPRLPKEPFVGEVSYAEIVGVLNQGRRWATRPERLLLGDVIDYLQFKFARVPERLVSQQRTLA